MFENIGALPCLHSNCEAREKSLGTNALPWLSIITAMHRTLLQQQAKSPASLAYERGDEINLPGKLMVACANSSWLVFPAVIGCSSPQRQP